MGPAFPNNLPDQLTSFVGRARELVQVRDALAETRLLTITGAGGAGKTRLALQLAADSSGRFPEGAWWVDLAPVADPELVGEVLAHALGVRPLPSMTALQAGCALLARSHALVILDNCEHLLAACAGVTETLLRACPGVTVLATSRAPLGLAGETDWRVPSLSLPPLGSGRKSLELLVQSDAVRLFIERARKARPDFAVTTENAPVVAQICADLDGLPLAIELASARVRMMSVEQISEGLVDRFHLLTGATRTGLPRHQTLRASVDWSHELLSAPERVLLRRLAVFADGFTLDLAEAVCAGEALERAGILDLLTSLVDKSLVVAVQRPRDVRYRLLETVRQYALERLIAACEASRIYDAHRDAMMALAERIAPKLHGPGQREWLEVCDDETANLTAALDHAAQTDGERALRLCVALTFWWKGRGLFVPAERGFAKALAADRPAPSSLRAAALWGRGFLAAYAGRYEASVAGLQQALDLAEQVGDPSVMARSLMAIGFIQMFADPVGSRSPNQRAADLASRCGDDWALITATLNLACAHLTRHELEAGERLLEEMLPLSERHGYLELQAWHWFHSSWRAWAAADSARVSENMARALSFARAAGEPTTEALAQGWLAHHEIARGRPKAALERMRATHDRVIAAGAGLAVGYTLIWLALAQAANGDIAAARAGLEQAVATGIDGGYALAHATAGLADILRLAGDPAAAQARGAEALAIAQRIGTPLVIASAKEVLGRVAISRARWGDAETLLHASLSLRIEHDLLMWIPQTFDALAEVAAGVGSHEEAARTLGVADRIRCDLELVRWAPDASRCAQLETAIRNALGGEAYLVAYGEGRDLALLDAVTWIRGARGERKRPAGGWESLTPTELRVVALVTEGRTNPEIGERMFITRGTVKVHLSHIFAKLGVGNRSELAAEATRRTLTLHP